MPDSVLTREQFDYAVQHAPAGLSRAQFDSYLDSEAQRIQNGTPVTSLGEAILGPKGDQPPSEIMQALQHAAHPETTGDFFSLLIPSGVAESASTAVRMLGRMKQYIAAEPQATGPLSGLRRIVRGSIAGATESAFPGRVEGWQPTIRGGKEYSVGEPAPIRFAQAPSWDRAAADKAALETAVGGSPASSSNLTEAEQRMLDQIEANNARVGKTPITAGPPLSSDPIVGQPREPYVFETTKPGPAWYRARGMKVPAETPTPPGAVRIGEPSTVKPAEAPPTPLDTTKPPAPKVRLTGNKGKGAQHSTNDLREAADYVRKNPGATDEEVDAHVTAKRAERHAIKYADAQNAAKLRMKGDTPPPQGTILSHTPDVDK